MQAEKALVRLNGCAGLFEPQLLPDVIGTKISCLFFVCCVALHPKSTAMVMAERSVHLTTLFPGQA